MNNERTDEQSKTTDDPCRRAEEKAREESANITEALDTLSPEDIRRLLHDLQVHQIELEMQNEELRRAQVELEASQARYFDLYDLAPVGYVTLSEKGIILEANLTSAAMLGLPRAALVRQPIIRFILKEDQDIYYQYRKQLLNTCAPQVCDMRMMRPDGTQFWARLEATVAQDADGLSVCRAVMSDITERKRTEEGLRMNVQDLSVLADNSNDAMVIVNADGRHLYVNQRATEITGYSVTELLELNMRQLAHPDEIFICEDSVRRRIRGEELPNSFQTQIVTKAGVPIHIEGTGSRTIWQGQPVDLIVMRDITERKRAEEALKTYSHDLNERVKELNCLYSISELVGRNNISQEEILQNSLNLLVQAYQYPEITACRITWGDHEYATENFIKTKWSQSRAILVYGAQEGTIEVCYLEERPEEYEGPFCAEERRVINAIAEMLGASTQRRRMEKTLREKEAEVALSKERNKAQQYLDIAEVMIVSLNNQGEITMINKRGCALLGYEEGELIGKNWFDKILPASCREDVRRIYQELVTGHVDMAAYHENFVKTKSGDERVIAWQNSILADDAGNITDVLSSGMDITERIAVRKENERLQKQVQQAQKMEAIGTLAGGIAHDFNNILSAIFGYSEIALSQIENNPQLEGYLHEVLIAAKRAKDLVQQILTFSRQSEQELKPVQVKLIAKEVLKLLKASLPSTIKIRQSLKSDLLVKGDPTQIHQIFMNICINAAHAMREHGGILDVKLENQDLQSEFTASHPNMKPGLYIKLSVSDTGHGMSREVMGQIFDPFFTTKKPGEGTGMGLSVVHGIVTSHGGTIAVYSEPGKGSTFDVFFQVIDSIAEQENAKERPVPKGTEHILFVDDEPDITNINKILLESLGYDVTISTSSTHALHLFKTQPDMFDIVITDMTMPDMTGDTLAQECMAIRPDIPVILCTGFSSRITEKRGRAIGIKSVVMKPILRRELAEAIRKVLDGQA